MPTRRDIVFSDFRQQACLSNSGAVRTLFARIGAKNKRLRVGLSRLAHFATGRRIAPAEVTDAVMIDLPAHVERDELRKAPRGAYRNACMNWNRAVTTIVAGRRSSSADRAGRCHQRHAPRRRRRDAGLMPTAPRIDR